MNRRKRQAEPKNWKISCGGHNFENIEAYDCCSMWEMFIVVFVRKEFIPEVSQISKQTIAKGKFGLIGNKGCVGYSFCLRDRHFNFISCHLKHGAENLHKRNKEAQEIIREFKSPYLPSFVECDSAADFTVFFGDLNYRIEGTYEQIAPNIDDVICNNKIDQLYVQM